MKIQWGALAVVGMCLVPAAAPAFRNNVAFWKKASTLSPYTWTGKGGNANWSTAGNWSTGAVPGSGNVAIFDADAATTCGANCSPTIDSNISVAGINMKTGYGGTISQGAHTITVGTSGWTMAAGTFAGGSLDITVYGDFTLTGGSFTSTSAYFNFPGPFGSTSTMTISSPSYFIHNSGWMSFGTHQYGDGSISVGASSVDFYNVMVGRHSPDRGVTFTTAMNALGSLTINSGSGSLGGSINAYGNITLTENGPDSTTVINVVGTANQMLTGGGTAAGCPPLNIQKTGGTLTLSGTIVTAQNLTWTSGTVASGSSTVQFGTPNAADGSPTINLSSIHLNNVIFNPYNNYRVQTITGTLYVDGNLTFDGGQGAVTGGTINVQGNTSFLTNHGGETTQILFSGNAAQTISVSVGAHAMAGNWTVNKSGGSLTLSDNVAIDSASQSMTVTAGSVNMNGKNLTIGNSLALNSNTLTKNAGVLTVNGAVAGTGALFGGTVAP